MLGERPCLDSKTSLLLARQVKTQFRSCDTNTFKGDIEVTGSAKAALAHNLVFGNERPEACGLRLKVYIALVGSRDCRQRISR